MNGDDRVEPRALTASNDHLLVVKRLEIPVRERQLVWFCVELGTDELVPAAWDSYVVRWPRIRRRTPEEPTAPGAVDVAEHPVLAGAAAGSGGAAAPPPLAVESAVGVEVTVAAEEEPAPPVSRWSARCRCRTRGWRGLGVELVAGAVVDAVAAVPDAVVPTQGGVTEVPLATVGLTAVCAERVPLPSELAAETPADGMGDTGV